MQDKKDKVRVEETFFVAETASDQESRDQNDETLHKRWAYFSKIQFLKFQLFPF